MGQPVSPGAGPLTPTTIGVLYGHRLDTGGVETHLVSLIRRCDPARFRWRLMGSASEGFTARVRGLGAELLAWEPAHALDATALRHLLRSLREHPVDLLHLHSPRATLLGGLAARRLGLPVVVTVHMPASHPVGGGGLARSLAHRLYGAVERRLLRSLPERVIHVSARAREEYAVRGVVDGRTVVIENGVEPEAYAVADRSSDARRELATPEEALVVACVARLDPQKGLDALLEAFGLIAPRAGSPCAWLIGDGPQRSRLEAHARRLGLLGRVRFLGSRTDVPRLLRASDIFVLPSRYETTSFALLEAMAAGLPIVATDVGDTRRLLGGDEGGCLVPPGDAPALAAALRRLMDDPELRGRLSAAAGCRVSPYTASRMAERTQEVYRSVLDSVSYVIRTGGIPPT